jgi:DNA polymerase elongation subunit (family B)
MYRNAVYLPQNRLIRLYSWDTHGNRISYDTSYEPYIYLETAQTGDAKSIFNTQLRKKTFFSQYERYRYVADNESQRIFENLPPVQQFLVDTFYNDNEKADFAQYPLKIHFIDIETYSTDSFPDIATANHEVIVITIWDSLSKKFYTWGTKPVTKTIDNCIYTVCRNEKEMFLAFLDFFERDYPDILSGWNSEFFDVPYIINRLNMLFGEGYAKRLSPTGRVTAREFHSKFGKQQMRWYIDGISCIDYLDIYQKFCMEKRASYKLNSIAELEISESKIDYGNQNLSSLADNDWTTFVEYNIQDVQLLVHLEDKLKYLELLRSIAYAGCTSLESALGTLSVVNGLCAIKARLKNLRIPTFNRETPDGTKNEGAYVGEPQQGFQEYICSVDASSLYPNVMITLNMSPETKIGKIVQTDNRVAVAHVNGQHFDLSCEDFQKFIEVEKIAVSMASVLFSQKEKGIIPEILDTFYKRRVELQKLQDRASRAILKVNKTSPEYVNFKKTIEHLNIRQHTIKILINSIYGYFGNKRAPLGDDDLARSVTLTGQAAIKQSNNLICNYIKTNANLTDEDIKKNNPIIYNDTDSCYFSLKKVAEAKNINMIDNVGVVTDVYLAEVAAIETYLNEKIKNWGITVLNSQDCRLVFKREAIADAGLFLSKKHYVIHLLNNKGILCNKFKYVGVEMVKTTMPTAIKPYAKKIVETMLMTRDKIQVDKVFNEAYDTFKSLKIEDIARVMGISDYDKYADNCDGFTIAKKMPPHVKAAYYHNLLLKKLEISHKYEMIQSGDKIRYISLRQPNKYGLKIIGYKYYYPPEFKAIFEPDYELMFEKLMFDVIQRFYQAVRWQLKSPSMNTQTDLFALFS